MKIVRPETITDDKLIDSNIAETVAAYNPATTYAEHDIVRNDADHGLYQSQQAANTGHALDDITWWIRIGPTNRWAMFDNYNQTQTVNASSIENTIQADGSVTGIAFLNLDASSIDVVMTKDAVEIFNQSYSLTDNSNVGNWYDYFVEPVIRKTDLFIDGLPIHYGPEIDTSINGSGTVKCGNMVIGRVRELGYTVYGAGFGIIDHSRKEVDDFGNVTIVERSYRKTGNFDVVVQKNLVDEVGRLLALYRATPIVYVGTDQYSSAVYYGFYRDFRVTVEYPLESKLTIEIEGLS